MTVNKNYRIVFGCLICIHSTILAQTNTADTSRLPGIIIKAYGMNGRLKNIPAGIDHVSQATLERFNPVSIVQAVNTTPGVRMEERSPGSYRFNIRGSSLRSPFGVRNVKVYYNDIPITDPGGHTYLNQLGYYNFNSIDIIKGPGSSFYGAGTGGVLLIESLNENEPANIFSEYATGSYDLQNIYGKIVTRSQKLISLVGFQHQQSDGCRDHSQLKRDVHSWNGLFQLGENRVLKTTFLYGNLFYQTPGALTKAEFETDLRLWFFSVNYSTDKLLLKEVRFKDGRDWGLHGKTFYSRGLMLIFIRHRIYTVKQLQVASAVFH